MGALVVAGLVGLTQVSGEAPADSLVVVVMETELGEIEITVEVERAPVTSENFLAYLDAGLYENGTFYRTVRADNQPDDAVRIAVIQGGMDRSRRAEGRDPIRMEGTGETGLRHVDGTISMARSGPDTAAAEFFICVGPQPELDEGGRRNPDGLGFAAFGRVTRGMDVVRAINALPAQGQNLDPPGRILGVRRIGA